MPEIEFITLANHAEALNGMLYILGGGWTDHWRAVVGTAAPPSHFGIGVSIIVPWDETNRKHHLTLRIESEDGKEIAKIEGDLEMGRPPGISPASDQRSVLAINVDTLFPAPGGYRVVGELGGKTKFVTFRVHDKVLPGPPQRPSR